jgi:hypothetical protein
VDNQVLATEGSTNFFIPYAGVRVEERGAAHQVSGAVWAETNWAELAGTDAGELIELGREAADRNWFTVRYEGSCSFYVDPLVARARGRVGAGAPVLAHELYFSARGQFTPGDRLSPSFVQPIGGFESVRGFPESFAIGDTVFVGTAEYRFHLPRVLEPGPPRFFMGDPFRVVPEDPGGRTDWDLILRAFVDVGSTVHNDVLSFERNVTVVGAGVGAEVLIRRNFNFRVDWGFALVGDNNGSEEVDPGDNRMHLSVMVLY